MRPGRFAGRLGHPSDEGRITAAEAAAGRYARMFHARVLSLTVAPQARPARRPAAAGKPVARRRFDIRSLLGKAPLKPAVARAK
jgi:hypothetical protein